MTEKTDRTGYNDHYKDNLSDLIKINSKEEYINAYGNTRIGPYYCSGNTKGFVRGEAIKRLLNLIESRGQKNEELTILDAGFGQGELSIYLGCLGFNVIGIDISSEAKECADNLAEKVGVSDKCNFRAESLEKTSISDSSIDYVIGHASLHHFIKYEAVPNEFRRVMKNGAKGFFADAFGENKLYHLFHDKEKMRRLGDVTLTKDLIESYFNGFSPKIVPTDWFVMLDKLYIKIFPKSLYGFVRKLSKLHNSLDRSIKGDSRIALRLSGAVITEISNSK